MKTLRTILLLAVISLNLVIGYSVWAQSSMNYDLSWHVMSSGGGRIGSASYMIDGTLGQLAAGIVSSASYTLIQGYWHPESWQVFLPLILG